MSQGHNPMAVKRLQKDFLEMQSDPTPGQWAKPDPANIMKWHYCIQGPEDTDYKRGFYVGYIIFPKEYPFKGPDIYMRTPNGRLALDTKLCLTICGWHPETWSPLWGPRTIINGIRSFMAEESNGHGSIKMSKQHREKFAEESGSWNINKLPEFQEYFPEAMATILDKQCGNNAGPSKKPVKPVKPSNTAGKPAREPVVRRLPQAPAQAKKEKQKSANVVASKRVRPAVNDPITLSDDDEPAPRRVAPKKVKNDDVIIID